MQRSGMKCSVCCASTSKHHADVSLSDDGIRAPHAPRSIAAAQREPKRGGLVGLLGRFTGGGAL